jgi:predicted anti-sigma-YlaC factor YlaD
MSNHVKEWLNAYLDGELKGSRLHQVEEHLAECKACLAELESLQGLSVMLHEVSAPEFISNERFVSQVNLRLPQRRVATTTSHSLFDIGWWMIPISLLMIWVFISTTTIVSEMVSVADNLGLLDKTTASFVSSPSEASAWTVTLGQAGMLQGNSLQWAERSESYTRNVFPQIVLQVAVAVLYLTWFAVWWARRSRQVDGQLLEG